MAIVKGYDLDSYNSTVTLVLKLQDDSIVKVKGISPREAASFFWIDDRAGTEVKSSHIEFGSLFDSWGRSA